MKRFNVFAKTDTHKCALCRKYIGNRDTAKVVSDGKGYHGKCYAKQVKRDNHRK